MNMTQSTMPQKTVTQSTVPQKTVMKAGLWLMMATLLVVGCAGLGHHCDCGPMRATTD